MYLQLSCEPNCSVLLVMNLMGFFLNGCFQNLSVYSAHFALGHFCNMCTIYAMCKTVTFIGLSEFTCLCATRGLHNLSISFYHVFFKKPTTKRSIQVSINSNPYFQRLRPASHQTKPGVSEEDLYRLSLQASSSNTFFEQKARGFSQTKRSSEIS